jgi:hypothetical protein
LQLSGSAAVGAFADFYILGDAYSYAHRMRGPYPFNAVALWWAVAALVAVPFVLNFGARRTLQISATVWAGLAIAHTILLIVEISADPTSHNLWPFEYIRLSLWAVPALLSAAVGRFAGTTCLALVASRSVPRNLVD